MKTIYLTLASLFLTNCLYAQVILKDVDAVTKHAESVMEQLKNNDLKKAYELLNKYWPVYVDNYMYEKELLEVDEFETLTKYFGKVIGSELIEKEQIKDVLIRMNYILKFENGVMYIVIGYYKNNYGWIVNGFDTSDNLDGLFK